MPVEGGLVSRFCVAQDGEVVGEVGEEPGDGVAAGLGPGGALAEARLGGGSLGLGLGDPVGDEGGVGVVVEGFEGCAVAGDPAPVMCEQASRANRAAVRAGRVTLGLGSAESTGLAERSVDHVLAVNNVAIWPDLDAGLRELHRVLRPGGTLLLAWHGGTNPSPIANSLRLPEDKLHRIDTALLGRLAGTDRVGADPAAAAEVARLCGHLPLALRIAGARLAARPSWPVQVLAARLARAQRRLDELELADLGVRASFQVSYLALASSDDPLDQAATAAFPLLALLDGEDVGLPLAARLLDLPAADTERVLERLVRS